MRLRLGNRLFDVTARAVVMGILDRTPDSSGGRGTRVAMDLFLARAEQLVREGADVLEVGGPTAAPGPDVTAGEEIDRVVPAVAALTSRFDVVVSVGSVRAVVARAAYQAGASVGDDTSGFADPDYLTAAATAGASVVATRPGVGSGISTPLPDGDDVVATVGSELVALAREAEAAGIPADRVIVDAGLALGKTAHQSLALLRGSDRLAGLGWPLLLSTSDAAYLGVVLGLDVAGRREAGLSATALGVTLGCRVVRARDVLGTRRVCDAVAAVLGGG